MKKLLMMTSAAVSVTALAYTTSITDTTGYVVQTTSDAYGESSIINGNHFPGGAPVAGKDYLVNNELTTRSPGVNNSDNTFRGDSLTLDGGADLVLKGVGSKLTIADLRVYNAKISQGDGNSEKTLKGGLTVYGTPSAPTLFTGSGAAGVRKLTIESAISGASGSRIKVMHSNEADSPGCQFYTFLKGNNSGYAGSFEVESADNGVCLVGFNNNAFGASPNIVLKNNGKLFGGGGIISLSGATITLDNGGLFGVYSYAGNNIGLQIGGNSTITGTGTLTINNSGVEGNHLRRVALAQVSITGIDGIQVNNGLLQLTGNYNNPTIPIVVTQPVMLRTVLGCHSGPITLQNASYVNPGAENVTYASLTLEQTEDTPPYIALAVRSGLITINGNLVNNLRSGSKIRIDFNDNDIANDTLITQLAGSSSYRLLTAANLGTTGVTADDFTATADGAMAFIRPYILGGTFSIETADSKTYLVYTPPKKFVYTQGVDGSGSGAGGSSFQTGTRWSDKATPHSDADYFICSNAVVRAKDGSASTFAGHSLSALSGSSFYAQGATATVGDLRLYGGSIVSATRPSGNAIGGNVAINGSAADPVIFRIEVNKPIEPSRALTFWAPISGSGSVRCIYAPGHDNDVYTPSVNNPGVFNMRGDNTGFTGEWQLSHFAIRGTFTSAANVGSASAVVFCSNAVFRAQEASFAIPAATRIVVNDTGSVAGNEEQTNGGTFLVDAGQTLTVNGVVSGSGILRKTGTGTLRLMAENTISGNVVVKSGNIGGTGKVNTLELEDGAGFDVSATQATPFEIGSLTVDGGIALNIRNAAGMDIGRIAVAKVGTLTGTLGNVKATVDGGRGGSYKLSVEGGILYAAKCGMIISIQ